MVGEKEIEVRLLSLLYYTTLYIRLILCLYLWCLCTKSSLRNSIEYGLYLVCCSPLIFGNAESSCFMSRFILFLIFFFFRALQSLDDGKRKKKDEKEEKRRNKNIRR